MDRKIFWGHVSFTLIMVLLVLLSGALGAGITYSVLSRPVPAASTVEPTAWLLLRPVPAVVLPTAASTVEPTATAIPDYCADQTNPAWENLVERNSLTREVYEAWAGKVRANGGTIFGASKCSLSVDSRIFGPNDLVRGTGPAQLVTDNRFTSIWQPEVDVTYQLEQGCTFTPLFAQGDAPVAFWVTDDGVRMASGVSNGVSLVGIVACP